jgi:non-canonical poly(A) RNA polymerase PAPD5/7
MDISLNQTNGVNAVPLVNTLLNGVSDRAARAMIAFVKAYLSSRGLNEVFSGGISSYSIICLVVSFLQLHPRVRSGQIDPVTNMGVLLVEFFELYGASPLGAGLSHAKV